MSLEEVTAALRDHDVAARRREHFLRALKLDGPPSREDIEASLQAKLEVPQTLPRSWLPLYQACVNGNALTSSIAQLMAVRDRHPLAAAPGAVGTDDHARV